MSSTTAGPDTEVGPGIAIAELATALIEGPDRVFAESGRSGRANSPARTELSARGWRPVSLGAAGAIPALQLLLIDDPGDATTVSALATRSVTPWMVAIESGGSEMASLAGFRHIVYDGRYDVFLSSEHVGLADRVGALVCGAAGADASIRRWRASALEGWHARSSLSHAISANQELIAMRQTLSWRITRPLRIVRRRALAGAKR